MAGVSACEDVASISDMDNDNTLRQMGINAQVLASAERRVTTTSQLADAPIDQQMGVPHSNEGAHAKEMAAACQTQNNQLDQNQSRSSSATGSADMDNFLYTANFVCIWMDAHGRLLNWNLAMKELVGVDGNDIEGTRLDDHTQPSSAQILMMTPWTILDKFELSFRVNGRENTAVTVLLSSSEQRDTEMGLCGWLLVGHDIAHKVQKKDQTKEELRTLVDTAHAVVLGIDADGLVNEWNPKAAGVTGLPKELVLGRDFVKECVTEDTRATATEVINLALSGASTESFSVRLRAKDAEEVELILNAVVRRDPNGRLTGVLCIGQDITDAIKLKEHKARLAQALGANEAKSQFLATMSHEMRTPLNVILGMNQLVMDAPLTNEQMQFSEQIKV